MTDSEHDEEFEAYLKRRASGGLRGKPLHKGISPSDPLEPPPELDRIIIGNARRAIQDASPVPLYRAPKWALPAALAATIVISFVVVFEMGLRQPAPAPVPVDAEIVADAPLSRDAPPPEAAAPDTPTGVANSHVASTGGTRRRAAAPTTITARAIPAPKANQAAKAAARLRLPAIPTDPWPPVAASNASPATDAMQARTRLARVEVAESRSRADSDVTGDAAPSISNAEPNPPAATPPRVAYAPARAPTTQTPNVVTLEEVIVTGPAPSHHARAAHLDPATWVSEIEKLHHAGRTAEAERQIKRFREAYPAYPLPSETAAAAPRAQ